MPGTNAQRSREKSQVAPSLAHNAETTEGFQRQVRSNCRCTTPLQDVMKNGKVKKQHI